ncbi:MAG: FFLEELY motif protein [Nevskiales bacterium]
MPPSQAQLDAIRELFEQYRQLPRHQGDSDFRQRLTQLQSWEQAHIRKQHAARSAADADYASVLNYYLANLHDGLPLDGMLAHGPQGLDKAKRMDKAFDLFANAIEYSVLSAVLQDRLTEQLDGKPITEAQYQKALAVCQDIPDRQRRLQLLTQIGQQVAPHIKSRVIHTGFKLLKGLFRHVGMAEIHNRMDSGFKELRQVNRLAQLLAEFSQHEQQALPCEA